MKLNSLYQNPNEPGWIVVVLAPTGIAAYNVNGLTIHRFFKLPVFGNSDYDRHWPLSDHIIKTMRTILPRLKLIIIGEF
jgi:ATP-dependent DNA helicase PIF1